MLKIIARVVNFGTACWFCWTVGNIIFEAGKEAQRKEDANGRNDVAGSASGDVKVG